MKNQIAINSLNAAILLSAGAFSVIIPIPGIMLAMLLITIFIYFASGNTLAKPIVYPLISICLFFFILSFIIVDDKSGALVEYFIKFVFMGFTGLFISQTRFDINRVMQYSCYLSVLLLPFFLRTHIAETEDWGIMMGISYYVIVFIISLIYYLFICKSVSNSHYLLYGVLLIVYILFFLSFASRGAILSIMLFLFLWLYIRCDKHKGLIILSVACTICLLTLFFIPIIQSVSDFAASKGLSILALNKMLYFLGDNLDNGRAAGLDEGLHMFYDSPIWGNGIASFEAKFKEGYVHNLFVQMLLEGGLILTLPFVVIVLWSFIIISSNKVSRDERYFMAFLVSISLVHLLFSETFWRLQYFWFYIGYTLRIHHFNIEKKWQNTHIQLSYRKENH